MCITFEACYWGLPNFIHSSLTFTLPCFRYSSLPPVCCGCCWCSIGVCEWVHHNLTTPTVELYIGIIIIIISKWSSLPLSIYISLSLAYLVSRPNTVIIIPPALPYITNLPPASKFLPKNLNGLSPHQPWLFFLLITQRTLGFKMNYSLLSVPSTIIFLSSFAPPKWPRRRKVTENEHVFCSHIERMMMITAALLNWLVYTAAAAGVVVVSEGRDRREREQQQQEEEDAVYTSTYPPTYPPLPPSLLSSSSPAAQRLTLQIPGLPLSPPLPSQPTYGRSFV